MCTESWESLRWTEPGKETKAPAFDPSAQSITSGKCSNNQISQEQKLTGVAEEAEFGGKKAGEDLARKRIPPTHI